MRPRKQEVTFGPLPRPKDLIAEIESSPHEARILVVTIAEVCLKIETGHPPLQARDYDVFFGVTLAFVLSNHQEPPIEEGGEEGKP